MTAAASLHTICSAIIGLDSSNQLLSAKWFVDPVRTAQVVSLAETEQANCEFPTEIPKAETCEAIWGREKSTQKP